MDLQVLLVQLDIQWCNPDANRATVEEYLWQQESSFDVVVLPEMFTTGFVMQPEGNTEPMNLHTYKWMQQMSDQFHAVLIGSLPIRDSGQVYNRLIVTIPGKPILYYDKRHLFTYGGEHEKYSPGSSRLVFEYKGWEICPLICYDLRFPAFSRNLDEAYDLLIYIANWPKVRIPVWETLLKARALENACYTVGVNRTGTSPEIDYDGHSQVIDFKGNVIASLADNEIVENVVLAKEELIAFRNKFPVLKDADSFKLL